MTKLFADTSYWIALLNPHDDLHHKVITLSRRFASAKVVTSEMVCVELLNAFSGAGPHFRTAVAEAVSELRITAGASVRPQTSQQFENALLRYRQFADKNWSATDCTSFQIMESENIRMALTSDRHFLQAGFEALMADSRATPNR